MFVARGVDARGHGGGLAEVAAETDKPQARVFGLRLLQGVPCAVGGAVIDKDHLVGQSGL